jgi:DNA-binding CsgD family transcriptional regulator
MSLTCKLLADQTDLCVDGAGCSVPPEFRSTPRASGDARNSNLRNLLDQQIAETDRLRALLHNLNVVIRNSCPVLRTACPGKPAMEPVRGGIRFVEARVPMAEPAGARIPGAPRARMVVDCADRRSEVACDVACPDVGRVFSPWTATEPHQSAAPKDRLTPRQRQVMELVLAGHPSKNIAADLHISQRTVENHRAAIMRRTGATSLPALARMAVGSARSNDFA